MITPALLGVVASVDAGAAPGGGGGGGNTLSRTTSGLVFRDQFNRSNRVLNGDNGWEESNAGTYDIVSNVVVGDSGGANGGEGVGNSLGDQGSVIVQANHRSDSEQTKGRLVANADAPAGWPTGWSINAKSGSGYRIGEHDGTGTIGSGGSAPADGTEFVYRLVIDKTVSPIEIRAYRDETLANLQDLSKDPSLVASATTTDDQTGTYYGLYDGDGSNAVNGDWDEFFVCGRNIVVSGIPTGWKIQVDSRTAVVESGGSVEIDVDAWALPATTIKLLDASDVEQDSLTPSGGIWGGDVYTVS